MYNPSKIPVKSPVICQKWPYNYIHIYIYKYRYQIILIIIPYKTPFKDPNFHAVPSGAPPNRPEPSTTLRRIGAYKASPEGR